MILNLFNKTETVKDNAIVNYFLIDYENVNDKGVNGLEHLKRGDVLYIFHNDTTSKMTIEMARTLFNLPEIGIKVQNIQVNHTGKNALDMILAATLGVLVASSKDEQVRINIISKDKGLCSLIENIPDVAATCNTTTKFTYNKAASIEECFVSKKPVKKAKQAVKTVKNKVEKKAPVKKETTAKESSTKKAEPKLEKKTVTKKVEKKPTAKKVEETKTVKKENKKPEDKKQPTKKTMTKQEKSDLLQHNDAYKQDINNLRKKLLSIGSLDHSQANKLANSLTGVIVRSDNVEGKIKTYLKDLSEVETKAVQTLESDIKALLEKY